MRIETKVCIICNEEYEIPGWEEPSDSTCIDCLFKSIKEARID